MSINQIVIYFQSHPHVTSNQFHNSSKSILGNLYHFPPSSSLLRRRSFLVKQLLLLSTSHPYWKTRKISSAWSCEKNPCQFPANQVVSPSLILYAVTYIFCLDQNDCLPLEKIRIGALLIYLLPRVHTIYLAVFELLIMKHSENMILPFHHFLLLKNHKHIFDNSLEFSIS